MQIIQYPLQYWKSGGVLLIPLAAVCFGIWLYFLRTRRLLICETEKATRMAELLRSGKQQGLQKIEGDFAAFVYRIFCQNPRSDSAAGLFDEESVRFTEGLKRDIVILAALTTVAPLLGLMGTVGGMIQTFNAVAATSSDTAARVASGVSRALITTQVGLVVAIPGVFGLARLRRMTERLQAKLGAVKLHGLLQEEP